MGTLISSDTSIQTTCYHCGDICPDEHIEADGKDFCCNGCKQVYLLLQENNLCAYYSFDENPGIKAMGKYTSGRFAYLNDEAVISQLAQFRNDHQVNITFSLPQMHCASCIFLLENLHKINPGIIRSQSNFQKKELFVSYNPTLIPLREVVELLAFIGYEPEISLQDTSGRKRTPVNRKRLYHLGVAGFAFANIMMLSFPEYFSGGEISQSGLKETFSWVIFGLSLPVLFYAASSIFISAWKGLLQKDINIDVPIALAIIITFGRSYYEIISGTGAGYLDSGSGIIFFMLIGRWFQDKTYDALSFDRDYHAYFPLGVTVIKNGIEENIPATKLQKGDTIIVRNGEMIPADAVLMTGEALVDYSFVSGENIPVQKHLGALLYAGGRQEGAAITLQVVKEVSQSYITQLWNNEVFAKQSDKTTSFIHPWSRYFTAALFTVAISAAIYWYIHNPANIWPVVTAVLIVACPCSLLLSATFTFGNMMRQFGKGKLYLKNASVIEGLGKVDTIVFDKTGTITMGENHSVTYNGSGLSAYEHELVRQTASQSAHSLSRYLSDSLAGKAIKQDTDISRYREFAGKGIEATINQVPVRLGAAGFVPVSDYQEADKRGSRVYVMIGGESKGYFEVQQRYREGLQQMSEELKKSGYRLCILSGDNAAEQKHLQKIFGDDVDMRFNASPQDKLDFVWSLQQKGHTVLMVGDGLNDAGALKQADVGMAVTGHAARFTPASDAIIDGSSLHHLRRLISYAISGKRIIAISFVVSILYNIVGLSFAVQGLLSPMVAAILMPASSISIVALVNVMGTFVAKRKKIYKTD